VRGSRLAAVTPGVSPYRPSEEPEALWDEDLTDSQRAWLPTDKDDLWQQVLPWRSESTTRVLEGLPVRVVELVNGAEATWDWRTVAFWVRALGPGWRVHLRHPGRVDLISTDPSAS
jgi:hypothetical protein